jgi:putative nucleotidyltransferase with HDIG domain
VLLCCLLGVGFTFLFPTLFSSADLKLYDLYALNANVSKSSEKFVVILASERTVKELLTFSIPQSTHDKLLENIHSAKLVIFDITLPDVATDHTNNQINSTSIYNKDVDQDVVYKSANLKDIDIYTRSPNGLIKTTFQDDASKLIPFSDGYVRDYPLMWDYQDSTIPSLALHIYTLLGESVLETVKNKGGYKVLLSTGKAQVDSQYRYMVLNPKEDVPIYEYSDVLNGKIAQSAFKDAVIIVAFSVVGSNSVPIGSNKEIPKSVFIANASLTLFQGFIPSFTIFSYDLIAVLFLSLIGAYLGTLIVKENPIYRKSISLIGLIIVMGVFIIFTYLLFQGFQVFLPPIKPLFWGLMSFALLGVLRLLFMSSDWRIQKLSIESLLILDQKNTGLENMTYPEYIKKNWCHIEKWSNVWLISPFASEDDEAIKELIKDSKEKVTLSHDNIYANIISSKSGNNSLFLPLPELYSKKHNFAILGWKGKISQEIIKSLSALILSTATYFKALEETKARQKLFLSLLSIIMEAVDAKDPTTAGHSNRVAELSKELAIKKGLSVETVDNIYLAGLLHDVGKLGIPDRILNKPGKLTEEEFMEMKRHPQIGGKILEDADLPKEVLAAIMQHHERLDGKGYPNNLTGSEVSLTGRIIKIADVYDALTSRRQYKEPMPEEEAYKILKQGIGTEFDQEILNLLLENHFSGSGTVREEKTKEQSKKKTEVTSPA